MNKVTEKLFPAAVFIVLTWLLLGFAAKFTANTKCLRFGYSSSKIDATFDSYCIKRVNQTDVVIPLSELKEAAKK